MMLQIVTPAASQFPVYPDPDPEVDSHYIKTYAPELITRLYLVVDLYPSAVQVIL